MWPRMENDDDDDDDDDDNEELFFWYDWPTKGVYALFQAGTIVRDSYHRKSPTRHKQDLTCTESELRLCWIKLWSSDNHYTTTPS